MNTQKCLKGINIKNYNNIAVPIPTRLLEHSYKTKFNSINDKIDRTNTDVNTDNENEEGEQY